MFKLLLRIYYLSIEFPGYYSHWNACNFTVNLIILQLCNQILMSLWIGPTEQISNR